MDEERVMLPHDLFRSLGFILIGSYRLQRLRQMWGLRLFLRRAERLRWPTWAAMGGLAREHIGHRARSPFGHRHGVPSLSHPSHLSACVFCCGSARSSRRQPSIDQFQSSMPAIGPRPHGDDDPLICNENPIGSRLRYLFWLSQVIVA